MQARNICPARNAATSHILYTESKAAALPLQLPYKSTLPSTTSPRVSFLEQENLIHIRVYHRPEPFDTHARAHGCQLFKSFGSGCVVVPTLNVQVGNALKGHRGRDAARDSGNSSREDGGVFETLRINASVLGSQRGVMSTSSVSPVDTLHDFQLFNSVNFRPATVLFRIAGHKRSFQTCTQCGHNCHMLQVRVFLYGVAPTAVCVVDFDCCPAGYFRNPTS